MSDIRTLLRDRLPSTYMTFPGDPDYDEARATWNIRTRYRPLGIVQPTNVGEIQAVLECVRQSNVDQVTVRSGGHSFEGLGLGGEDDKALVVDLVKLNKVEIRQQEAVAILEGGALLGDLYREAWNHGELMVPAGSCVAVGVGGQIQCGGYGHYTRTYGILADRVLQCEVVTADGRLLVADENINSDLFWAVLGNGTGSYGIITKIKIKLNEAPKGVATFSFKYRRSDIDFVETFTALQDYALSMPTSVNPWICVWLGDVEFVGAILAETEEQRDALIEDMRAELPPGAQHEIRTVTFLESVRHFGLTQTSAPWYSNMDTIERERDEHLRYMTIRAGFIPEPFTDEFIERLAEVVEKQPTTGSRIQLVSMDPTGGPPVDATSIPTRGGPWAMGMSSWLELADFPDEATLIQEGKERDVWLDQAYETFYPYSAGGYIGDDDMKEGAHGRDIYASYWGTHLPRLKEIKRKYDPTNLFHHKLSIPLD
ncbi:FAD-binding oxidoreductase [Nocardia sp. NPDC051570]|uniref:FAD-binding oxidoreductase n=1 Tax=Nocardia sp. NPDC051570 TaxID=3364324 RepID=UPI0037AA1A7E